MTSTKKKAVKFGTPPPKREVRYDWNHIAEQLRKKPNEWALIFEGDLTSLVTAIRIDGIAALRKTRGFETRTANNTKGTPRTCDLWMRYRPDMDEEQA